MPGSTNSTPRKKLKSCAPKDRTQPKEKNSPKKKSLEKKKGRKKNAANRNQTRRRLCNAVGKENEIVRTIVRKCVGMIVCR